MLSGQGLMDYNELAYSEHQALPAAQMRKHRAARSAVVSRRSQHFDQHFFLFVLCVF